MKGIILAGGEGTRLHPMTISLNKHLIPVYDKPMIYYPLSVFLLAGIKEILLITSERFIKSFENLLGNGKDFGVSISYKKQENANGIGEAFLIGEEFIGNDNVSLILGDNIFYGTSLQRKLTDAKNKKGATIFAHKIKDPKRYGVVEFNSEKLAISLEEKPLVPKSNYAVPGLYFYDNEVVDIAKKMNPSERNELEITDINNYYLKQKKLNVIELGRGTSWFDCGTEDSLIAAGSFVQIVERRQGFKIGCLEEIAFNQGLISSKDIKRRMSGINSNYSSYVMSKIGE